VAWTIHMKWNGYVNLILVDTDQLENPDYFKLFFPDELFNCIATNTNKYTSQFFDKRATDELPVYSRFRKWTEHQQMS